MNKHFRPRKIDETHLLPLNLQDYLAKDHLSRLIVSVVRESLNLSEIAGNLHERARPAAVRLADDDGLLFADHIGQAAGPQRRSGSNRWARSGSA
jgi:hypothetical protein